MHIDLATIIVDDYDEAIEFYVRALGFELVEDSPATGDDGGPKRWVVVRPPDATTGLLLARADGDRQDAAVGDQFAGRVGMFLRVDDFDAAKNRMDRHGVEFVSEPRDEPYGRVAVFVDIVGNRWDLLGPAPAPSEWDEYASSWDDDPAARAYAAAAHESLVDVLTSRRATVSGRVLDFGCGTGLLAEQLVEHCERIDAVDSSSAMLDVLRGKVADSGWAHVFASDCLPNTDDAYDLIVASSVCSFLDDYPGTVAQLFTLLKPGGIFVQWDWERTGHDEHGLSRTEITSALDDAGFQDIEVRTAFSIPLGDATMEPLVGVGTRGADDADRKARL